ncbi:MAG: DUF1266 domain-containing protein [Kofleriaceae bacterium]
MLSTAQRWALAPCAILTRYNLDDPCVLGGMSPGDEVAEESRELLAEHWQIRNTERARWSLARLFDRGHRAQFTAIRTTATGTRAQRRFVKQHAGELGERSLIAWDLGRVAFVAGKAHLAGYLDEAEAWTACFEAARILQRSLASWEQLGREYLLGREFFFGVADASYHHVYRALVLEREGAWTLPWATPL